MFFANDKSELLTPEQVLQMSGLTFMQKMLDGQIPGPPMAQTMGYWLHSVEDGRVAFRGAPGFEVSNPMGTVHGGWYGTVLDSAMACSVMTRVPPGSTYTTLEYKINVIRSIPQGTNIECIGTVDHVGRSTAISHGEIRGIDDNRLYATGSTTCIIMDMSKR